jgi:hypothetical protein
VKTKPKQVNHFTVADLCRANPGQWQDVGEYNSSQSAWGVANTIRRAYVKAEDRRCAWTPAGAFEARHELTEFGARVEARYMGEVAPLVELEAQGCRTWQLTPRNITAVDDEVDRDGIYAKGYFEWDGDKTVCVGLRIGAGEDRIVARFGDHVIRHPDGRWSVRHAPADTGTEGQA